MKILWSKESLIRLQQIEEYISKESPQSAIYFVNKLISVAESLKRQSGKRQNSS